MPGTGGWGYRKASSIQYPYLTPFFNAELSRRSKQGPF